MLEFFEGADDDDLDEECEFSLPYYKDHRDNDVLSYRPTWRDVQEWTFDSICEATDGCTVEPDGKCEHGHLSWMRVLGIV